MPGCHGGRVARPDPARAARRAVPGRRAAAPARRAGRRGSAEAFGGARLHPESPAEVLRAFARVGITPAVHPGLGVARGGPPGGARCCWSTRSSTGSGPRTAGRGGGLGAGRAVPRRVRARWGGLRPVGHPGRRRVADSEGGAAGGGGRAGLAARGRRRRVSWSRGCWRRCPGTPGSPRRRLPATSTRRWPGRRSAATGRRPRWPCSARCTARPAARRCRRWRCCRRSYPTAFEYVEAAARTGEGGGLVRSWLGRTCPPASVRVRESGRTGRSGGDGRPVPSPGRAAPGRAAASPATSSSRRRRPSGRSTLLAVLRARAAGGRRRDGLLPARRGGGALPRGAGRPGRRGGAPGRGERAGRLLFGDDAGAVSAGRLGRRLLRRRGLAVQSLMRHSSQIVRSSKIVRLVAIPVSCPLVGTGVRAAEAARRCPYG